MRDYELVMPCGRVVKIADAPIGTILKTLAGIADGSVPVQGLAAENALERLRIEVLIREMGL